VEGDLGDVSEEVFDAENGFFSEASGLAWLVANVESLRLESAKDLVRVLMILWDWLWVSLSDYWWVVLRVRS
jgi:hypothetical protein